MIRSVIFDIDNTLYSYDDAHAVAFAALTAYAERELGLSAEAFRALHKAANQQLKGLLGSQAAIHNRLIRYQNMLEQLGQPISRALTMSELYWDTLVDAAQPTPGAAETMAALRAKGIRIGVGTDMTARMQLVKLKKLGLLELVDFMVSSEEAGAEKPAEAMFRRCVEKAGVPAAECLFVGDSLSKDVKGPMACGLRGAWYCPDGAEPDCDVPVIRSLGELLKLIE